MIPQQFSKSNIVKIIKQLDNLLPSNFLNKQGRGRKRCTPTKAY